MAHFSTELESKRVQTNQKQRNTLKLPALKKGREKAHLTSVDKRTIRGTTDSQLVHESAQEQGELMNWKNMSIRLFKETKSHLWITLVSFNNLIHSRTKHSLSHSPLFAVTADEAQVLGFNIFLE